jgi:hypothetical protein
MSADDKSSSGNLNIPALTEKNWAKWYPKICAFLRVKGLWKCTQSDGTTEAAQEEHTGRSIEKFKYEWTTMSERAADYITFTLSTEVTAKLNLNDFKDAHTLLIKLQSLYEPDSDDHIIRNMCRLLTVHCREKLESDPTGYLSRIKGTQPENPKLEA